MRRGLLLGLALTLAACPSKRPGDGSERLCPSACASLSGPACGDGTSCSSSCGAARAEAEQAGCTHKYDAFLGCLSARFRGCLRGEALRAALAHGVGAEACQSEYDAFARCARACREHGVVRTAARRVSDAGEERTVLAELTTRGCGRPLPPERHGAPAGARCEHESVCDPVECACPAASESYRVRACVDATCADRPTACRLAPLAVNHSVCRP